jgi:hypothetical protein
MKKERNNKMKHTSINKKLIKTLALTLTLVILFGMMPPTALANNETVVISMRSISSYDAENENMEYSTQSICAFEEFDEEEYLRRVTSSYDIAADFKCSELLEGLRSALNKPHPMPILMRDVIYIEGIEIQGSQVTSLAGIEHFFFLRALIVSNTQVSTLDLSKNAMLEYLDVSNNQLTSLILSPVASYRQIDVRMNYLPDTSAITGNSNLRWDTRYGIACFTSIPYTFSPQRPSPPPPPALTPQNIVAIENFVSRLLTIVLNRTSYTETGHAYWVGEVKSGRQTGISLAHQFFFSPEFINSNVSDEVFIQRLIRALMGREPNPAGVEHFVRQLQQGISRERIFADIAHSAEFSQICADYGIARGTAPSAR